MEYTTTQMSRRGRTLVRIATHRHDTIRRGASAFGEDLSNSSVQPSTSNLQPFFTGKPAVDGLGYAFLMRNYRASLAKWQTADPMGYPDGWNQLAYCGNGVTGSVDLWGCTEVYVKRVVTENKILTPWYHGTDDSGVECEFRWRFEEYDEIWANVPDGKKTILGEIVDWAEFGGVVGGFGIAVFGAVVSAPAVLIGGIACAIVSGAVYIYRLNEANENKQIDVHDLEKIDTYKRHKFRSYREFRYE